MTETTFVLTTIGHIHANQTGFSLALLPPFRPALVGLAGFSHIQALWWADQLDQPELRQVMQCSQPYRCGPTALGIYATRSPLRPNPICLSTAVVLGVDDAQGIIQVAYIDAAEGTPLIDIKPYTPSCDRVRELSTPDWCRHWPQWYEDSAEFDWGAELVFEG